MMNSSCNTDCSFQIVSMNVLSIIFFLGVDMINVKSRRKSYYIIIRFRLKPLLILGVANFHKLQTAISQTQPSVAL